MSKTEVSGKQLKDGSVELVDLAPEVSGVLDTLQSDVATLQTDVAAKADAGNLAPVATSGSYNDLSDKPSIPSLTAVEGDVSALDTRVTAVEGDVATLQTDVAAKADSASLSSVATSGSYTDLTNKPTLFDGAYSSLTGAPSLADVATSGSYNDLLNKPSIPSIAGLATETYVDSAVSVKADSSSLATVATSGSYNDLSNKPSIPSISGLASETYVDTAVAAVVNSAPAVLDTLNELSAALGNDENFATTVAGQIGAVAADVSALDVRVTSVEADVAALQGASAPNLSDLGEVAITTPSSGQVLKYNGTGWANAADSTFSGDYNDLSNKPSLFSGSYTDLTNKPTLDSFTTLTSPSSGQFLKYDGSAWVNSSLPSANYSTSGVVTGTSQSFNGVKTFVGEGGAGGSIRLGSPNFMDWAQQYVTLSNTSGYLSVEATNSETAIRLRSMGNGFNNWNLAIGRNEALGTFDFTTSSYAGGPTPIVNVPNYLSVGLVGSIGAKFQVNTDVAATKGLIVKGAASQTANLFEVQNSASVALVTVSSAGTLHASRYTETVANAFNTSLAPSSGTLTVDTSVGNAVLGALSASVTTWAFTNVPTDNSKVTTVTAVLAGNASYTYGDACSVNGIAVSGGILWSGGSAPSATANTDIITFIIVRDSAGTVKVFGSATTNFS